jgi:creatinine amidohydrolase
MNGHDGNIPSIESASRCAKTVHPDLKIASLDAWWHTLIPLLPSDFFVVWNGFGHGGEGELSMGLALFPELCRQDLARGVVPNLPSFIDIKWMFSELTDCGATGDPTKASREKGKVMAETLVNAIVTALEKLEACGWDYRSPALKRI